MNGDHPGALRRAAAAPAGITARPVGEAQQADLLNCPAGPFLPLPSSG